MEAAGYFRWTQISRRWLQWRLRTLLIGLTVACVALGALVDRAARDRRATEWLAAQGFRVLVASNVPDWMPAWLDRRLFTHGFLIETTERSRARGIEIDLCDDPPRPLSNIEMYLLLEGAQGAPNRPLATELTDETCEYLGAVCECRMLRIRDAKACGDAFGFLRVLDRLEFLDLSGGTVADADLQHLAGLKNLQHLYLSATGVTDGGLRHLVHLSNLRTLKLDATAVSDDGIAYLKHLRATWHIDLRRSRVSERALDELAQALPDCSVNGRDPVNGW
jgi:hypothetical protein